MTNLRFTDPKSGIRIDYSRQARQQLGDKYEEFNKKLLDLMKFFKATWAYISKRGTGLEITMLR